MKEVKILEVEKEVLKRIDMICRFACCKYTIKQGSIINIKGSNIAYVKPHILKVKGNDYLILEEGEEVFINGYNEKIKLKDLEKNLKKIIKKMMILNYENVNLMYKIIDFTINVL